MPFPAAFTGSPSSALQHPAPRLLWPLLGAVLALHLLGLWLLGQGLRPAAPPVPPAPLLIQVELPPKPLPTAAAPAMPRHAAAPRTMRRATVAPASPAPRIAAPVPHPAPTPAATPSPAPAPAATPTPTPPAAAARATGVAATPEPTAAPVTAPAFGAAYLHNPKPEYPRLAQRLGEQGTTLLRVKVAANGAVESIELQQSCGYADLDANALRAVQEWTFTPAQAGGKAVAGWVVVPIRYALSD
jgi:protein TonB